MIFPESRVRGVVRRVAKLALNKHPIVLAAGPLTEHEIAQLLSRAFEPYVALKLSAKLMERGHTVAGVYL